MKKIRLISNGFGEDLIACQLLDAFGQDSFLFEAVPLVGPGNEYKKRDIQPKCGQEMLPSGGFLFKVRDFIRDVRHGLIGQFLNQWRTIVTSTADYQLVVGDIYALFMASRSPAPIIFMPTAKSERAIPHWGIEFMLIKKYAKMVFPRDIETHQKMCRKGIPSYFFGNPMFDAMTSDLPRPNAFVIGILPGSRAEGLSNLKIILTILETLELSKPVTYVIALPAHFTKHQLALLTDGLDWQFHETNDCQMFINGALQVNVSNQFMDVLQQSSVIIGLAGTANEQAMFAKRPVISFIGSGPQSSKKRFLQQQQLIGGAISFFIESKDPSIISTEMSKFINQNTFHWTPLSNYFQQSAVAIRDAILSKFQF
ncbi:MAG: lipid-A-disaccharide synthase-related protein [Candidatus Margulisiibacteriota bacterium]